LTFKRISYPSNYYQKNYASSPPRVLRARPQISAHQWIATDGKHQRCFWCLAHDHPISDCRFMIHYRDCLRYDHISRFCHFSSAKFVVYRKKDSPSTGPSGFLGSSPENQATFRAPPPTPRGATSSSSEIPPATALLPPPIFHPHHLTSW
jgi:hypothetical protein